MSRFWLPVAGAAVTGALLGLCARIESPFHILLLVALVPWLVALERATIAVAAASGAVAAIVFTGVGFAWFPSAIGAYSGASSVVGWAIMLALAPILFQPQMVLAAAARQVAARLAAPRWAITASFLLVWGAAEWLLPRLFADTLGFGLHPSTALRQAADLVGAQGLTLIILGVNAGVASALRRRVWRPAAVALALVTATWGYGAWRHRAVEARLAAAPTFTAGVVQANITRYDKLAAVHGRFETVQRILREHFELSAQLLSGGALEVLIWPETVYPTTYGTPRSEEGAAFDRAIDALTLQTGVPLVFGAYEREPGGGDTEYNSAFFLDAAGGATRRQSYRKTLLFPLTEYVPPWMDSDWLRSALPWTGRWTRGPGPAVVRFRLASGREVTAAPLICYEVTSPGYVIAGARAGADFIVTLSNDSWFPDQAGPRLHLLSAAFRSIETGLPQVRATNSGISALISSTGEVRSATGFDERAVLRVDVPLARVAAPFASWGRGLGPTLAALATALGCGLVVARLRRRRPR
jgi:apolipoprotein N-acyltransferase